MLPMTCTSHLHMQCRFMSSELTNTDSRNRPVPEKRLDILSLLSLVFLQIKAIFVFHDWFKNFCAIQSVLLSQAGAWSEQLYTGRLRRFCQYNLNLLWGLQDWNAVPQAQPYGSWKLQAVQASYLQGFPVYGTLKKSRFCSIWKPYTVWEPLKKTPISDLLHFSLCPE